MTPSELQDRFGWSLERAEAALRVLSWLEAGGDDGPIPAKFNMNSWSEPLTCGTSACIGGAWLYAETGRWWHQSEESVTLHFGLVGRISEVLQTGIGALFLAAEGMIADAPQAARTFRHFLETGTTDWSL